MLKCPNPDCDHEGAVDVLAQAWATVWEDDEGDVESSIEDCYAEYTPMSAAVCPHCGHGAAFGEFDSPGLIAQRQVDLCLGVSVLRVARPLGKDRSYPPFQLHYS